MRRFVLALTILLAAVAANAEPLMVRISVYHRMPRLVDGYAPEIELPGKLLDAPDGGWPPSYDAMRATLSKRLRNRHEVMIAEILPAKPLTAAQNAAFFIPELAHAIEVKLESDAITVILPKLAAVSYPIKQGTQIIAGKDEQLYLGVTILPASKMVDDTMVIMNGTRPLNVVSRFDPEYPKIDELRNRSGVVLAQLKVEKDGSVSNVEVLEHVNPRLETITADALKKWRFQPAVRDGHPMTAYMIMSSAWHVD